MRKLLIIFTTFSLLSFGLNDASIAGCSEPNCRSSDCAADEVCHTPRGGGDCGCIKKPKPKKMSVDGIEEEETTNDSGDDEEIIESGE